MGRIWTTIIVAGLLAGISRADDFVLNNDNTNIKFKCSKPGTTHDGGFKGTTGTASYDGKDLTSLKFVVDIDVNSIYTDEPKLTAHLKTPDFFDAKGMPKAKFTSSKVEKDGDKYKVTGKLNLHGKTEDITFPATIAVKDGSLVLNSKFDLNRHQWAISYGKGFVEDTVHMDISVNAKKK